VTGAAICKYCFGTCGALCQLDSARMGVRNVIMTIEREVVLEKTTAQVGLTLFVVDGYL